MSIFGFVLVLGGMLSYLIMLFILKRFTYKTWIFDAIIGTGLAVGILRLFQNETTIWELWAIGLGVFWFAWTRYELKLQGSKDLLLKSGTEVPAMTFTMIDGTEISQQYLIDKAPVLLVFYRGWWCPSSKTQLDEIIQYYDLFSEAGVSIYAASVDSPDEAAPIQEYVGEKITILCNVSETLLDEIGNRDHRGAPWYDRLIFGAPKQDISMPSALIINSSGKVAFAARSLHVDDRPRAANIIASL